MKARTLLLVFMSLSCGAQAAIEKMNDLIDQASKEETTQNKAVLGKLPDSKTMTFYHDDWTAMRKKKKVRLADVEVKLQTTPGN